MVAKSFVIGNSDGHINKMVLINKADETRQLVYYLHPSGTVDTQNTNRISPVFFTTEYVESDSFAEDAEARARETLTPQQYDNLIELTYANTDKLVPTDMPIGTPVTIIGDSVYNSILTGYERTEQTTKLIFGVVRVDLTKKLILERRQNR